MSKEIDDALGMRPLVEVEEKRDTEVVVLPTTETTEEDLQLAKNNIKDVMETGKDAIEEMSLLAKQSESPRAFEVLATLMKTMLKANKDYVDTSMKKHNLSKTEPNSVTNVTNNNLVMSTADVLKMLKGETDK